jgi:hypothetical protein
VVTAKHLRLLSEGHISYEINELLVDARRLPTVAPENNNPVLEALLIHARVLLGFFYAKEEAPAKVDATGNVSVPARKRPGNEVYAFEFVDGGEEAWNALAPRENVRSLFGRDLRALYTTISTRIGHLTVERIDKVGWYGDDMVRGLSHLIRLWRENLTADAEAALEAGQAHEADRARQRGVPWYGDPINERRRACRGSYQRLGPE